MSPCRMQWNNDPPLSGPTMLIQASVSETCQLACEHHSAACSERCMAAHACRVSLGQDSCKLQASWVLMLSTVGKREIPVPEPMAISSYVEEAC